MKTNYQIVMRLTSIKLEKHGYVNDKEIAKISEIASLKSMDKLALHNFRDYVTLYFLSIRKDPIDSNFDLEEDIRNRDLCSAIQAVVDSELLSRERKSSAKRQ